MDVPDLTLSTLLKANIAYTSERQKVLAQNIANADVPGYRAKDLAPLNFADMLSTHKTTALHVTSNMHRNGLAEGGGKYAARTLRDTFEVKPTGNSIAIDEQMMKVARNASEFQMSIALYKKIGAMLRMAVGAQSSQ